MTTCRGYFQWCHEDPAKCLSDVLPYFAANGYAVLRTHATPAQISTLREGAASIIEQYYLSHQKAPAFFGEGSRNATENEYFISSAREISCFLECEQIADKAGRPAINKIGHALHDLHSDFRDFSRSEATRQVAHALGFKDSTLVQSMYILKNAIVGGEVVAHRDATFVYAKDDRAESCLGFWWSLEHATEKNGCLWVVPGSHLDGSGIRKMFCKNNQTSFEGEDERTYDDHRFVSLQMAPGDLVVIHGGLVHRSLPNRSEKSRHAYSIHVVKEGIGEHCWLNRADSLPFRQL